MSPKPYYKTRGFLTPNPIMGIMTMTFGGLSVVMVSTMLGLPPLLTVPAFLATLVWLAGRLAGDVTYVLTDDGLERHGVALFGSRKGIPEITGFRWDQVESYRTGSDRNRSLQSYDYLEIRFSADGAAWKLTANTEDKADLERFVGEFEERMRGRA